MATYRETHRPHPGGDRLLSRASDNLPLWVVTVLLAGAAIGSVIAESTETAIGFGIAAAVVAGATAAGLGHKLATRWSDQPMIRQFVLPVALLALAVIALIVIGAIVASD